MCVQLVEDTVAFRYTDLFSLQVIVLVGSLWAEALGYLCLYFATTWQQAAGCTCPHCCFIQPHRPGADCSECVSGFVLLAFGSGFQSALKSLFVASVHADRASASLVVALPLCICRV
jgi:hypothetical protein